MYSDSLLSPPGDKKIAKFTISGIPSNKNVEEIKVKVAHNKNGIIQIESAELIEEIEVLQEVKVEKKRRN